MPGFEALGERGIHDGHVIRLVEGSFRAPDGTRFEREIVHHPGAVSVVPLHDDGTVTLIRQFRAPVGGELLEIPAGKRDVAGEAPDVTAGRELIEEVGLDAGRLELLAEFYNSPGFCDERSFVYLATDLQPVDHDRQGVEEHHLTLERFPLAAAGEMVADRRIVDAKTIIGLTLAARHVGRG